MKKIRVEVICVGSELLSGRVNTHTAALGTMLERIGLKLSRSHEVGDDVRLMKEVFSGAWKRSDLVLCAGGLGPTFDDLTRDVWSSVLRRPLRLQPHLVREIREKFRSRGLAMPPFNRRQGYVLKGAEVLPNFFGTAPGQFYQSGGKVLVLLPGPSREMIPMMEKFTLRRIRRTFQTETLRGKSFHLIGVPESVIDHKVRAIIKTKRLNGCRIEHGILASASVITVKFQVAGANPEKVDATLQAIAAKIRRRLGPIFFGEDDDRIESVIGARLKKRKQTLSVAESCTGGLLAKMMTDNPGASDYFLEGVVTYSNASKRARLGVKPSTVKRWGAVSRQAAMEMASGIKRAARSDYSLSVTGIAGPSGGSAGKPVGLVYIGCATPRHTIVKEFRFSGDREWIRHRAAMMALETLRQNVR